MYLCFNRNRLAEVVLTSIHNLCFIAKIRKIMFTPCKPQFHFLKVGFKGGCEIHGHTSMMNIHFY